jgi:hypothetical protein
MIGERLRWPGYFPNSEALLSQAFRTRFSNAIALSRRRIRRSVDNLGARARSKARTGSDRDAPSSQRQWIVVRTACLERAVVERRRLRSPPLSRFRNQRKTDQIEPDFARFSVFSRCLFVAYATASAAICESIERPHEIPLFETMLWFTSRGDECLNCETNPILSSNELIIRVHKHPDSKVAAR